MDPLRPRPTGGPANVGSARPQPGPPPAPGSPPPAPLKPPAARPPASLPPSLQSKFRAARRPLRREVYDTTSFYRTSDSRVQELDDAVLSGVKSRPRSQVRARLRRSADAAAAQGCVVVPALGRMLADGRASAEAGRALGVPGVPYGGGLLGALVGRSGPRPGAQPAQGPGDSRPPAPAALSGAFLNKTGSGIRDVPLMSPAPVPRPAAASAAAVGQRRLTELIRAAAGRVGDLLSGSDLREHFRAVEAMQEALSGRAQEQLRAQALRPTWG
jgi:hypothetical protein